MLCWFEIFLKCYTLSFNRPDKDSIVMELEGPATLAPQDAVLEGYGTTCSLIDLLAHPLSEQQGIVSFWTVNEQHNLPCTENG